MWDGALETGTNVSGGVNLMMNKTANANACQLIA